MLIIKNGGVSSPLGFKANGIWSGIKKSGKPDLALIVSDNLATAAGVFTKNSIKAAPLIISQKNISNHKAQAIVVNSGNANCFTGSIGLKHAQQTTAIFAKLLKISTKNVIVTSTGIIGKQLPFNKIKNAAPQLIKGLSKNGSILAAKAILTTDLAIKQIAVEIRLSGQKVILGACAKGSGMIAPNMATMLGFITTDAAISPKMLTLALKQACDESFNAITIDGCMSTNDMVVVLAMAKRKTKPFLIKEKIFRYF